MKQQQKNDIQFLKEAFCDFFIKLLPAIHDPQGSIRARWHQFRNLLLDETKPPIDVYLFAQQSSYCPPNTTEHNRTMSTRIKTDSDSTISHQEIPQTTLLARRYSDQAPNPAAAKYKLTLNTEKKYDRFSMDTIDEEKVYTKCQAEELKNSPKLLKSFPTTKLQNGFSKFSSKIKSELQEELQVAIQVFRKDGQILQTIYGKSFEINTSDAENEKKPINQHSYMMNQQDLKTFQKNYTLKGYSIYAKNQLIVAQQLNNTQGRQQWYRKVVA